MFKEVLQSISGIEIFPIIGLILFLIIFIIVIVWTLKLDKKVIREMENLPFDAMNRDGEK